MHPHLLHGVASNAPGANHGSCVGDALGPALLSKAVRDKQVPFFFGCPVALRAASNGLMSFVRSSRARTGVAASFRPLEATSLLLVSESKISIKTNLILQPFAHKSLILQLEFAHKSHPANG